MPSLIGACMGFGKTATSLALADRWDSQRILILCPKSVLGVWRGQIPKHSNRDMDVCVLDGGSVKQRVRWADLAWRSEQSRWRLQSTTKRHGDLPLPSGVCLAAGAL